jgi:hypothetical protein
MMAVEALQLARSCGVKMRLKADRGLLPRSGRRAAARRIGSAQGGQARSPAHPGGRPAAEAVLAAAPPEDCSPRRWAEVHGLQAFVASGWADQALLLGWTPIELYRVSFVWFRVDLTGAALLIGADPSAPGRAQLNY